MGSPGGRGRQPRRARLGRWVAGGLLAAAGVAGAVILVTALAGWARPPRLPVPRGVPRAPAPVMPAPRTPSAARVRPRISHLAAKPGRRPVRPVAVAIPSIGVRSRLVGLGLNGDGTLQVPGTWNEAGWYRGSSVPGAPGPAVIVGHVDSNRGPAVFFQLRSLQPGALVVVRLSDGSSARYRVNRLALFPKAAFPTRAVYGPTRRATLRLITCGGPFDFATGHYLDNLVVFAGPAGSA